MNPNARIPAAVDDAGPGGAPIRLWESAAIMLYLAEKHGSALLPADARRRQEVLHWLFFQMGSQGPIAGQFAHFFMRCPLDRVEARDYGIDRYGTMVMYACDVLDRALDGREYLVGDGLTLADLACYPWCEPPKEEGGEGRRTRARRDGGDERWRVFSSRGDESSLVAGSRG